VVDFAEQAAPTFIVNKYGKDSDANYALTALGGAGSIVNPEIGNLADEVKKWPEEDRQEMQDRKTRAKISDVLGKEALTPKDEFYLGVIAQDPSVVKFGYADENHSNDDFKLWLLTRGNDLLKGTAAHRKTWEISND
jgi:hypothetical protein